VNESAFYVNRRQIPRVLEAIVKLIQQEDSVSSVFVLLCKQSV